MSFDNPTLFNLLLLQGVAAALVLALMMGRHGSPAARWAQAGMGAQALGWLALAASGGTRDPLLLPLAMCGFSAALSALWWAVRLWLPATPRAGRWFMLSAPLLMPAGYVLLLDASLLRIGWAQAWLALQLLVLAAAALLPQTPTTPPLPDVQVHNGRRWRALLGAATLPLALMCLARGGEAISGVAVADSLFANSDINTALALAAQLGLSLLLPALLLAWRAEAEGQLARLAQTDSLTGLTDRRSFAERAAHLIAMARRHNEPLALMMLDLDFLRTINAERGQDAGDRALALFGSCLQAQMRLGDLVGRVGGEEFAVLMTRCDALGPPAMDQRMRAALAAQATTTLGFAVDFSSGWAKLRSGDRHIVDLMQRAEAALYIAKREGRGRLVAEPGLEAGTGLA
ncbi:MAG: GGDEF domain-containing protein [Microbacteriaceae bacterium]|nr:GGDEF domain-containing protein [Burkholderiaceae bacterium]